MNLLRRLRFVTAARYDSVAARLRKTESRLANAAAALEELRADAQAWKARAEDAHARLKAAADQAKALERATSDLQRQLQRQDTAMRKDADRYARRVAAVDGLQDRLAAMEREVVTARDDLMAVETKMEILEAAANALDLRTRAAIAPGDSDATPRA
jgi:chromosome segregation ATPase